MGDTPPANIALCEACYSGSLEKVRAALDTPWVRHNLLQRRDAINEIKFTHQKLTLMHAASLSGSADVVALLASHGADPDLPNADGLTPLHQAVGEGSEGCVRKLIEVQADVNAANAIGVTPLHLATLKACQSGNTGMMAALLEAGARIRKAKSNLTPVDIACTSDDLTTLETLLTSKDLLEVKGHVRTLCLTLERGAMPVASKLLQHVGETSARVQVLVRALQFAQSENRNVTDVMLNVKLLLQNNAGLFPGGVESLLQELRLCTDRGDSDELIRALGN